MKYHRVNLKVSPDHLYLLPIGDLHAGHMAYDEPLLDGYLRWVDEHRENTRILLMGDLMECATKTSVGKATFDQSFDTNSQIRYIKEKFAPYADIIDGAVIGNHEMRIVNDTSVDVLEQVCDALRIPYLGYMGYVVYGWNKVAYTVLAWHGATGGTTSGGALNSLERMAAIADADVYLMGHSHKLTTVARDYKRADTRNDRVIQTRQVFVGTGSCLAWDASYSEAKGYPIPKRGFARIRLDGIKGKKDIHVSL